MKKKTALGLVILGAAAYLSRGLIRGTAFAMQLAALICWMTALILWLTGPFESPRMKRFSHIMLTLIAACAAAGLVSFVWIEGLIFGGRQGVPMEDVDILVVLGAGLWGDKPSPMLTSRLETALDYLDKHPGCVAVLSGGQGSDELRTEASAMAAWLEARGIDPSRLYLEEGSRNTAQNVKFSLALMEKEGLTGKVAVISSEFHLYRARRLFMRYDMEVGALPAPTPDNLFTKVNSYIREYFSIVVMGAKDILGYSE